MQTTTTGNPSESQKEYDDMYAIAIYLAEENCKVKLETEPAEREYFEDYLYRETNSIMKELESLRPETIKAISSIIERVKQLQRRDRKAR